MDQVGSRLAHRARHQRHDRSAWSISAVASRTSSTPPSVDRSRAPSIARHQHLDLDRLAQLFAQGLQMGLHAAGMWRVKLSHVQYFQWRGPHHFRRRSRDRSLHSDRHTRPTRNAQPGEPPRHAARPIVRLRGPFAQHRDERRAPSGTSATAQKTPASAPTSRNTGMSLAITGVAQAIASISGSPKPSASEGISTSAARR